MEDCVTIQIKRDDRIIDGQIWYEYISDDSDILVLHLVSEGIRLSASAHDCFTALVNVRKELEGIGDYPLVMGAHERVYPSPMQRSMGDGRKAYLQRMGSPALQSDCVDIFDPCNENDVSTVEMQERYHNAWIADAISRYKKHHS